MLYLRLLGKLAKSSDPVLKQALIFYQHTKLRGESQADISETKVLTMKSLVHCVCKVGKQQNPEKCFRETKTVKCPPSCSGIIPDD